MNEKVVELGYLVTICYLCITNLTKIKKIMMRKLVLSLALLISATFIQAQDLTKLIPSDAIGVFGINAENYSKKVDMDKVLELDVMKMMDSQLKSQMQDSYDLISLIYKDPKAAGVNLFPKSYVYTQLLDSLVLGAYITGVSDKKKLEEFLQGLPMIDASQIQKGKGYRYVSIASASVAWTSDVLMVAFVEGEQKNLYAGLDYDDEEYYDKLDARRKAFDKTKAAVLSEKLDMVVKVNQSVEGNANFAQFQKSTYDMGLWLNLETVMNLVQKTQDESPMMAVQAQMMESMSELWENNYHHTLLTFDDGEINMAHKSYTNDRLFNLYKGVYDKKLQPKMMKYVNGASLLGLGAFSVDIKKTFEAALEIYRPMFDQIPQFGGQAESVLDLLGIALDEDALANIFDGEMLVAVTDFKEVEVTYIAHEYDDDYNLKKVEKTRKQQLPLIVAELGIGNKENFMKLIQALENFNVLTLKDGIYTLALPDASGLNLKLALVDGLAIITNDDALLANGLDKGVKKKDQLSADLQADMLKNNTYFLFDVPNIVNAVMGVNKYMSTSEKEMMEMVKSNFDEVRLTGIEEGDKHYTYHFKVKMIDQKMNSAMKIFEIINEAFMAKQQGGSEGPVEEKE